jgi:hypothetical protein
VQRVANEAEPVGAVELNTSYVGANVSEPLGVQAVHDCITLPVTATGDVVAALTGADARVAAAASVASRERIFIAFLPSVCDVYKWCR